MPGNMDKEQKRAALNAMNIQQLRSVAKRLNINKFSSKKKATLVDNIIDKCKMRKRKENIEFMPTLMFTMPDRRKPAKKPAKKSTKKPAKKPAKKTTKKPIEQLKL